MAGDGRYLVILAITLSGKYVRCTRGMSVPPSVHPLTGLINEPTALFITCPTTSRCLITQRQSFRQLLFNILYQKQTFQVRGFTGEKRVFLFNVPEDAPRARNVNNNYISMRPFPLRPAGDNTGPINHGLRERIFLAKVIPAGSCGWLVKNRKLRAGTVSLR